MAAPRPKADRAQGYSSLTVGGWPVSRGLARWQLQLCFSVKCEAKDISGSVSLQFKGYIKPNLKNKKDGSKMFNTIDALNVRINNLQQRDPVGNARIIAKLKRRVRSLENK